MNNQRNRRRRNKAPSNTTLKEALSSDNSKIVDRLQTLVEYESTQIRGVAPTVPDVPKLKISRSKVYTFERSYILPVIAHSTTVDQAGAIGPTLAFFPGYTDFTTLFDQYRIIQFSVEFINIGTTGSNPFYTVIDYDDTNSITSLDELLQYQTLAVTSTTSTVHSRTINPRIAGSAYGGTVFTNYSNLPGTTWLDVASPSVQYYGLKYFWPASTISSSSSYLRPVVRGIIQCRSVR